MISSKRFVAVMMAAILLLALTYVSVTNAAEVPVNVPGPDSEPPAKWNRPAAVVVQTCGFINAVILTNEDGGLERFDYSGLTTESLRLYLNKVGQVIIVNAPCDK